MPKTILDPDVADEAPSAENITPYDEAHFITYARLLDAESQGADWREVTHIVLHRDFEIEPDRTRRCWETHLKRARWMRGQGAYRLLNQRE